MALVMTSRSITPASLPSASVVSAISLLKAKEILPSAKALFFTTCEVRSVERRCTTVTDLAKRVRKVTSVHRRFTAADNHDVAVVEEEAVAGRASDTPRTEPFGRSPHVRHPIRAVDALGETGKVLDPGCRGERAADKDRVTEDERLELGAGGVESGGASDGAGADDDDLAYAGISHEGHVSCFAVVVGVRAEPAELGVVHAAIRSDRALRSAQEARWKSRPAVARMRAEGRGGARHSPVGIDHGDRAAALGFRTPAALGRIACPTESVPWPLFPLGAAVGSGRRFRSSVSGLSRIHARDGGLVSCM